MKRAIQLLTGVMLHVLLCNSLFSQTPVYHHIIDTQDDYSIDIRHVGTLDGGIMAITTTIAHSTLEGFVDLVKLDSAAHLQWFNRFDPGSNLFEDLVSAPDGGFYFSLWDTTGRQSITIMKIDSAGNYVFGETYSVGNYQSFNGAPDLMPNTNGVYAACGFYDVNDSTEHLLVMSIDGNGNIIWSNGYNAGTHMFGNCDVDTCANGDIVVGANMQYTSTHNNVMALTRITPSGNLLWSKYYITPGRGIMAQNMVRVGSDDLIISGIILDTTLAWSLTALMKTDGLGNVKWIYTYSDSGHNSYPMLLSRVENENVAIVGFFYNRYNLVKVDSAGNFISGRVYWSPPMGPDVSSFDTLRDGRYCVAGVEGDPVFSIAGPDDSFTFYTMDKTGTGCTDSAQSVQRVVINSAPMPLTGQEAINLWHVGAHYPDSAIQYFEWTPCSSTLVGTQETMIAADVIDVFPNPASEFIRISASSRITTIEVIDIHGRIIQTSRAQSPIFDLNVTDLNSGIYFIRIFQNEGCITQKIVVQH